MKCTDCERVADVELCTECSKPVCPAHRSGTGRLADGYQCTARECWTIPAIARMKTLREALGWPDDNPPPSS